MTNELLDIKGLSFARNGHSIIDDLDMSIGKGEIAGLMGDVGAGKSTLAQIICNLIEPDSGTLRYYGKPASSITAAEFLKMVSIVFQFPEKQIFCETVYREIAFGLNNLGYDTAEIDARINMYTAKLGLPHSILQRPPLFLSGGEMRKVALVSSFVMEPDLLILDEPFSWLDEDGCIRLRELIAELKSKGSSFIIISHDDDDLRNICSHLWRMMHGKISEVQQWAS